MNAPLLIERVNIGLASLEGNDLEVYLGRPVGDTPTIIVLDGGEDRFRISSGFLEAAAARPQLLRELAGIVRIETQRAVNLGMKLGQEQYARTCHELLGIDKIIEALGPRKSS